MPTIIRLPEDLSNQIAAGEVVERPASVVKELVENAIDAQARRIQVDVVAGGVGLIRVTDDGTGMDEQDALLALERHATSKIGRAEDLLSLRTFGFRGEAVPSIASVSRFVLRTRTAERPEGVEVTINGGGSPSVTACGLAPGTVIEVRDLFFNVPARRKFLKTLNTETAAIATTVDALALAAPPLTFVLTRDGRESKQWLRAPDRQQRVASARSGDQLAAVLGVRGPLSIEAYLGPPESARAAAHALTILVNNRVVRERVLARIVAQAYGGMLESGRYPSGVVYLDIDPRLVDVNVHPQKAEVRFADARAVQDSVFHLVSDGIKRAFGVGASASTAARAAQTGPSPSSVFESSLESGAAPASAARAVVALAEPDPWELAPPAPRSGSVAQEALPLSVPTSSLGATADAAPDATPSPRYGQLRFLSQVHATYLVCEGRDGIVIIDQHAAAERVAYARLRQAFREHAMASQRLLIAATFAVSPSEAAFLEESSNLVSDMGFEIRGCAPGMASVSAVPQIVSRAAPERLARDLLDEMTRSGERVLSAAIDKVFATVACHGSLRAGDGVSPEEAQALLSALDAVDHGGHCPHGRPLLVQIDFRDLERQVARR